MMATTFNGRTKVRGRGVAAALAMAAAMLWRGGGRGTVAHAQSRFETPPVLPASELAPPDLLQGPTFTVDPQVPIVGMLGQFTLRADVGTFEAHGREMLRIRVGELHALAQIERMSKSDVFLQAAARAAARPVESMANIAGEPCQDGPRAVRGGRRFFGRVHWAPRARYRRVGAGAEQHGSGRADRPARGGLTANVFGYESERRALAKSLGVDPYTTNPVLAKKLNDMAWVPSRGGSG